MDSSQLMIQVLGKVPLCKGFSPFQLHCMLELCDYRTLKPGVVLCEQGEQIEAFYILVAGEIIRLGEWGAEVERLVSVELVGFVEAMTASSYAATWQAEKSSHVFVISRTKFEQMLMVDGEVQDKVLHYLRHVQAGEGGEQSEDQLGAVSDYLAAEDLKGYGFDGFIEKTVGLDQLQNMVEMTLQK